MPYGSYVNAKINVMTRIYNRKHNDLLMVLCLGMSQIHALLSNEVSSGL